MSALVFMDTETTGLSLDDDIWEFAAVRREEDGHEMALHLFIEHDTEKCINLPESFCEDHIIRWRELGKSEAVTQQTAALAIHHFFAFKGGRPHVVGAVPNFDTERVARLLARFGHPAPWHYHLVDVENLVVGWLHGVKHMAIDGGVRTPDELPRKFTLPWDSNELSRAAGVNPDDFERHTAMGDVQWAKAIYDKVMAA